MCYRYLPLFFACLALTACPKGNQLLTNFNASLDQSRLLNNFSGVLVALPNGLEIKKLQRLLAQQGYKPGPIDGLMGRKTKAAIRAYQRTNNLTINGLASSQMLAHIESHSTIASNLTSVTDIGENQTLIDRCVKSEYDVLNQLKSALFNSVIDELQIDVSSYLEGFCVPADQTKLAKLYIFLVTEGVIHSRLATTKYNQLATVYEQAGIDIAVNKDSLRRSTESLQGDIKKAADNRIDGASALIDNSFEPDDNANFQASLKAAYEQIEANSPYKQKAQQLLSEVLTHSSSSAFYLVRSSYTIDKLSNYFGINITNGINLWEKAQLFTTQVSKNMNLAYFLLSKQSDLSSMLLASIYSIKALTQDVEDIPRLDSRVATQEVRELKREGGLTLDAMEIDFDKDNRPRLGI